MLHTLPVVTLPPPPAPPSRHDARLALILRAWPVEPTLLVLPSRLHGTSRAQGASLVGRVQ